MQDQIAQQTAEAAAMASGKVSYFAGISMMVVGGLTMQEWFMFIGALTALGTFLVNWYYKHKHLKLAEDTALKHAREVYDASSSKTTQQQASSSGKTA